MNDNHKTQLVELTSEIVAAYVSTNHVQAAELPALIRTITRTLRSLGNTSDPVEAETPKPAVPIQKSVTDDYLISLFDGRKFRSLKRHLMTEHNVNPGEYRTMFGLPKDYPMVAPSYTKQRSLLAKSRGLGRKPAMSETGPEATSEPETPKKRNSAEAA